MEDAMKKNPVASLLVKASLVSFILSAILLLITSSLMLNALLSASAVSIMVIVTYILSNFIGGFLMGRGMGHRKFVWGLAAGGVYFIIVFLLSLVVVGTKDFSLATTIRTLGICGLSGMIGGMIS